MSHHDRTEERLAARLHELAGSSRPTYRDEILLRVDRTRQRPAWTFPERWIPMTVITFPGTRQRGVPRALKLLAVAGLLLALAAGLVAGGMRLLPPSLLQSTLLVPVVEDHDTWESTGPDWPRMAGSMDVGPDGRLLVPDLLTDRVVIITPDGTVDEALGSTGAGPEQLSFRRDPFAEDSGAGGVAWLPDGSIAIADAGNHRLVIWAADGGAAVTAGGYGVDDGQLLDPIDVAVGPDGTIWVADDQRDDLSAFDRSGTFLRRVGEHGSGPGQLDYIGGVDVDAAGNLYNADFGNARVHSWDAAGYLRWTADIPRGPGADRGLPLDLDVDAEGFTHVTTDDGRLVILSPDGAIVGGWEGLFRPTEDVPLTVAVADDGVVYVAELLTGTIHRLRLSAEVRTVMPAPDSSSGPAVTSPAPSRAPITLGPTGAFPVPFEVTAPEGWVRRSEDAGEVQLWLENGDDLAPWFIASIPYEVYADPCDPTAGTLDMGSTPRDLAEAIVGVPGVIAGDITDTTIDGRPAALVDFTNVIDIRACADKNRLHQWRNVSASGGPGFAQGTVPGSRQRLAVVDVDGTRVIFWLWFFDNPAPDIREAYGVFDSLRIP